MTTSIKKSIKVKPDLFFEGITFESELKARISIDFPDIPDDEKRQEIIDHAIDKMTSLINEVRFHTFRVKGKVLNVSRVFNNSDGRSYTDNLSKIKRPRGGLIK